MLPVLDGAARPGSENVSSMSISSAEARILVVEDDAIIREMLGTYLKANAMEVLEAEDIASALAVATKAAFDLALVDLRLPDGSGFDLVGQLRQHQDCGVIYITSLDDADTRVHGLESGGDDYIVKPVDFRELLARVRAVLRRYRRLPVPEPRGDMPVMEFSGWIVDLVRREIAAPSGELIPLTRAEFDLLAALIQGGGTPLSRDYLLEVVASADSKTKARTIDVMVSRIRRKLAAVASPVPQIRTRKGEGYSFEAPAA
jgi:two-component system torCAD operon response regulator TorR